MSCTKIVYNDVVSYPLHDYLMRRLQRAQLVAAGFVNKCYADVHDKLRLGWLPVKERQEYHLSKLVFKLKHYTSYTPVTGQNI